MRRLAFRFVVALAGGLTAATSWAPAPRVAGAQAPAAAACADVASTSGAAPVRAVLCRPGGSPGSAGPLPAVVYLHDDGGASEGQRPNLPPGTAPMPVGLYRDLAAQGFVTLGIAYFSQTPAPGPNPDVFATAPPEARAALPVWRREVADGVAWLRAQPGVARDTVGVVGWSTGATLALLSAAEAPGRYQAVVALSAPLQLPGGEDVRLRAAALPATLLLQGDADAVVPPDQARAVAEALAGAGRPHELVVVPGGTHPWVGEAGLVGRARLLDFLRQTLQRPGRLPRTGGAARPAPWLALAAGAFALALTGLARAGGRGAPRRSPSGRRVRYISWPAAPAQALSLIRRKRRRWPGAVPAIGRPRPAAGGARRPAATTRRRPGRARPRRWGRWRRRGGRRAPQRVAGQDVEARDVGGA